jgi:3-deoxy-manno-octulosonate cytidylyltransferase (CMP-KDO synthetase)
VFHIVIPARFSSARLPGKPLLTIAGRPLLQWVWQSAIRSGAASVIIATDDERIRAAAGDFGAVCVMTSAAHASGTDRIAEVALTGKFCDDDVIVNLQGDEPMMPPEVIGKVAAAMAAAEVDIATAVAPIRSLDEFLNPNHVKAVMDLNGRALYFSRAPVPWPRERGQTGRLDGFDRAWRHIGLYAYRVRGLLQIAAWPPTALEQTEQLEQLRALQHGMHIQLVTLTDVPPAGVDTPQDLERVRAALGGA